MGDPKIVYVSGPYRNPDLGQKLLNILTAWRAAEKIWGLGHVAICPHANTILMNEALGAKVEVDFVAGDLLIIERCCDALYMLEGWQNSVGAGVERAHAEKKGINIFYAWNLLERYLETGIGGT